MFLLFPFFLFVQQKSQIANLVGSFASGIFGLMSNLVQGLTAVQGNAGAEMANQFSAQFGGQLAMQPIGGIFMGGASSSGARGGSSGGARGATSSGVRGARLTRSITRGRNVPRTNEVLSPILPSDNTILRDSDSSSSDSSGDDDAERFVRADRKGKGVVGGCAGGSSNLQLSLTFSDSNEEHNNSPGARSPDDRHMSPPEARSPVVDPVSPPEARSPVVDLVSPVNRVTDTPVVEKTPIRVYERSRKKKSRPVEDVDNVINSRTVEDIDNEIKTMSAKIWALLLP